MTTVAIPAVPAEAPASRARWWMFPFGVLTPLIAVVVERSSHVCEQVFFDPLPTAVHVAAYLGMAGVNLALWIAARRGREPSAWLRGPLWGAALAVSLWYAAVFAVLLPASIVGIAFMGIGLLSLSPLTALWTAWKLRTPLRRGAWAGGAAALALLCAADLPAAAAHVTIAQAAGSGPGASSGALAKLRALPASAVLDAGSGPPSLMSPLGALTRWLWEWDRASASTVAWRATGQVPRPRSTGFRGFGDEDGEDAWSGWDASDGRIAAGERALRLETSEFDGDLDAASGVADLRWTLVFRNDAAWQAEVRATLALPPGAVVSDATLWVEDLPRDAVFAGRAKAVAAYQQIVAKRRDPLLVTSARPGHVLVQCFPVPPKGGTMKIRLRLAVPLLDEGDARRTLTLPNLAARNFGFSSGATHEVTLRTTGEFVHLDGAASSRTAEGVTTIRASLPAETGLDAGPRFAVAASSGAPTWAEDVFEAGRAIVAARESVVREAPPRLVVVVDASGATVAHRDAANVLLAEVPDGTDVAVIAASDYVVDATGGAVKLTSSVRDAVGAALAKLPWTGGVDDLEALRAAVRLAAEVPGARVVWLHGPQARFAEMSGDRSPGFASNPPAPLRAVPLVGVRVAPGRSVLADEERLVPTYEEGPRAGSVADRVRALANGWYAQRPTRELVLRSPATAPAGMAAASALAARPIVALWAARETARREAEGDTAGAIRVAVAHRVVTPATGALVLENDAQYKQTGIAGLDPGSVPISPEPATWAVLGIVAAALLVAIARRRREARPA